MFVLVEVSIFFFHFKLVLVLYVLRIVAINFKDYIWH